MRNDHRRTEERPVQRRALASSAERQRTAQDVETGDGERRPTTPDYESKHERFHDEFKHDPSAIRAECRADEGELGGAALDLAEHEGGDVGARDEHDHPHRGERRKKCGPRLQTMLRATA